MKHTEIALRRPVTTVMVFVALAMVGIVSSRLLPLEEFPDIAFPGVFIQIPYPGSTPEEIERLITRPVEEVLATLSGIERMESTTRENQAEIRIFMGFDQDPATAGIEARAKIDGIRDQLPQDIQRFFIFTGSLGDQPILQLRISSERDLGNSYEMLDRHLKRRIERIDGISQVRLEGVDPREIRILLDSDRVAAHGVDLNQLLTLLQGSNFSVSAGRITDGGQRFSVRPKGEFRSLADIENLIVGSGNLRLSDIADIELRSPERNYGRHLDGAYSVGLSIFKETGANIVDVADRVMEEVAKIREIPQMEGVVLFTLQNSADEVRESLNDLLKSGLIGAVLAILVLYMFLRQLSTTLVVTLAVPFSLLITLGAMYAFDLSINTLTMMGLMLAVGMLVDNAVVITESIFRYRQLEPDDPHGATVKGVREVGLAVITGTATSVIVFVPILFGEKNGISVFLIHVAITITVAMLASLVIAQTLIPMLASRLPPPKPSKPGALMTRLSERYASALAWTLRHPWWSFLFIGITFAVPFGVAASGIVKNDPFPQDATRRLFLPYHIEGTHPLDEMEKAVDRVEAYLFANTEELEIRSVYSYFDLQRAESTILLTGEDDAKVPTEDIMKRIEEELPEIVIGEPSFDFNNQGGQSDGFSVQITGDSTERLAEIGREVVRIFSKIDGMSGVRSDIGSGELEVRVSVDRDRAMSMGLSTEAVAQTVAVAMRGQNLTEFRGENSDIDVRLAFRDSDRQSLENLADLPLYTDNGERINLGAVANFHVQRGPRSIERKSRQTAVAVRANLGGDLTMDNVKPRIEALMNQVELPPGYRWQFGQGFDDNQETQTIMLQNILLGIALIFIVMAALFESALYPISIITSIIFSILGVFLFFAMTGTTFTFMASIGIMILIGVVVNNGIVLVDHINNLRREGMARNEAVLQGGRDRLRPILMTVFTTILGLTPLAVSTTQLGSTGASYFPMARAIIGGLAFSTMVSLLVVPRVYCWVDSLSTWGSKVRRVARGRAAAAADTRAHG